MECQLKENCTCEHQVAKIHCPNYTLEDTHQPGSVQTEETGEMKHVPVNASEENGMNTKDNLVDGTNKKRFNITDVAKKFTTEYQPSGEAKAAGHKKKKFTRDSIRAILNMPWKGPEDILKELVAHFGEEACKDLTMGDVMTMRQAIKAAKTDDTAAYNAAVNQGMGMPVQAIAQTDTAGNDLPRINITPPPGFTLGMPSNTESDEVKPSHTDAASE